MLHWIPYAFVRIVVFFMAGILVGIYFPDFLSTSTAAILFFSLIGLYFVILFVRQKIEINPGFIGLATIFVSGYLHVLLNTDSRNSNHFVHLEQPVGYYQAVVTKYPDEKENSWKTEARVLTMQAGGEWKSVEGNVLLYFSKKDFPVAFQYGDVLMIKGSPVALQPPANPGEFDYKRFLTFRKIYHQHFLRQDDAFKFANDPPSQVMKYAIQSRLWAKATLQKDIAGEREQATASALVLGVTDGLDDELLSAYAATGAMHVLAVSGLHVGIIYWIILLVCKPLNKTTKGKWAVAIISIFILWGYAFVTGIPPSVLRAVTMFSFVALARPWKKSTNIYNILAASAFCLLLYEPYLIMSVGFQLSYLAVLGIVYLQPGLYQLWEPRYRFWDEVWKITCVSIAAQVATFSLGLLYFHQFPNYFLISNLVVIPASFGILVGGLALLALSFLQPVASGVGFLLELLIKLVNFVVFSVQQIPFSLIENISITTFQCWLLMGIVVAIVLVIQFRKFHYFGISTLLISIFSISQWTNFYEETNSKKLTIYKVAGHHAMELTDTGASYFFSDSMLKADEEKIRFHIRPNRLITGVQVVYDGEESSLVQEVDGCELIRWNGMTVLRVKDKEFRLPQKIEVDFLVISNNVLRSLDALLGRVEARQVIIDSSNSFYVSNQLLKTNVTNVPVHSVLHEGAFEINFKNTEL